MSAQPRKHRATPARQKRDSRELLAYLIVLAGVVIGLLLVAGHGGASAPRGTVLVGWALVAAALARLVLPVRYAGLLANRHKAIDAATFALLGGGILGLAMWLS